MRLAVIPARGGSKRIPRKNIVDVGGRPMLAHVLETAKASGLFARIHVSTDDVEVAAVAKGEGFPPDFMRDPALADDHTPLLPVLQSVLRRYEAMGQRFDSVCMIMATAILIEPRDLIAASTLFEANGGKREVMAVADFPCPVEWAFRLKGDSSLEEIQPGMGQVRSQDLPKAYYDAGTLYFYPPAAILDPRGATAPLAFEIPRWKAVDIDGPDDLAMAEMLFRGRAAH